MIRTLVTVARDNNNGFKFSSIQKVETCDVEANALRLFGTLDVNKLHECVEATWWDPDNFGGNNYENIKMLTGLLRYSRGLYNNKLLGDNVNVLLPLIKLFEKRSEDIKFETMYNMMFKRYDDVFNSLLGYGDHAFVIV